MSRFSSPTTRTSLRVVAFLLLLAGLVLCGTVVVKAAVIGFYDSDMPWMIACAAIGVPALWVSERLFRVTAG